MPKFLAERGPPSMSCPRQFALFAAHPCWTWPASLSVRPDRTGM